MTSLRIAFISDIHVNHKGNHADVLAGESAQVLSNLVTQLNQQPDLSAVLIGGDLVDNALPIEFSPVESALSQLTVPYYIIPGNHDRRELTAQEGLTLHEFARRFNPQYNSRPQTADKQAGYWSISLNSAVQLIGLDSIRTVDWGGVIDETQLSWLREELTTYPDKCVIIMVHHPLHRLSPLDDIPKWKNFVCNNGGEVIALLDEYPQVKLVLTAHHHLTKADVLGTRIHLANPAIAIYPCAYRTIQLTPQANNIWQIAWQTHQAVDETLLNTARQMMLEAWQKGGGFKQTFVEEQIIQVYGTEFDRQGEIIL